MNLDAENVAPPGVLRAQTRPRKGLAVRDAAKPAAKQPKQTTKRRALGDITNRSKKPLGDITNLAKTPKSNPAPFKPGPAFRIPLDEFGEVVEPDIMPPTPPPVPYEPRPLFDDDELAEMRSKPVDDGLDEFGKPLVPDYPDVEVPPMPFNPAELMDEYNSDDDIFTRPSNGSRANFNVDQLFTKDDFPVFELA